MSGVFYIGLGDRFDGDKVHAFPPGSVIVLPATLLIFTGRNPANTSRKSRPSVRSASIIWIPPTIRASNRAIDRYNDITHGDLPWPRSTIPAELGRGGADGGGAEKPAGAVVDPFAPSTPSP